jgi:DNA-binding NarL/FixJ family response regulator
MIVLSVDDHLLFSEGLKAMTMGLAEHVTFLQAASLGAALEVDAKGIEIVLLDYHLPDVEGFQALTTLREAIPNAKIVVVSGEEDPALIKDAISLGASGYIPKSSKPDLLIAALQLVFAGGTYLPPHVLEANLSELAPSSESSPLDDLSDRQKVVLHGAVQGKMNKTIADELNIAEGTVKAHLSAAYKALGVRTRTEAVYEISRLKLELP